MLSYIKGFIALFVLLIVLLHLAPGKSYQKYIRFFAEMLLTISLLTPVLSVLCDKEEFLDLIEYEAFMSELQETSKDMEKIEYLNNDHYIEEYESAIETDVRQMAEVYDFVVQEVTVDMAEDYTISYIKLELTDQTNEQVVIGKIVIDEQENIDVTAKSDHKSADGAEENDGEQSDTKYAALLQDLEDYYQIDRSKIGIQYTKVG